MVGTKQSDSYGKEQSHMGQNSPISERVVSYGTERAVSYGTEQSSQFGNTGVGSQKLPETPKDSRRLLETFRDFQIFGDSQQLLETPRYSRCSQELPETTRAFQRL